MIKEIEENIKINNKPLTALVGLLSESQAEANAAAAHHHQKYKAIVKAINAPNSETMNDDGELSQTSNEDNE